jgi:hypothetical protein
MYINLGSVGEVCISEARKIQYTYTKIENKKKPHFPGTPKKPISDSDFFFDFIFVLIFESVFDSNFTRFLSKCLIKNVSFL